MKKNFRIMDWIIMLKNDKRAKIDRFITKYRKKVNYLISMDK